MTAVLFLWHLIGLHGNQKSIPQNLTLLSLSTANTFAATGFCWVSSLAYTNFLGTKGPVLVAVEAMLFLVLDCLVF
jgi:hypothetical protein